MVLFRRRPALSGPPEPKALTPSASHSESVSQTSRDSDDIPLDADTSTPATPPTFAALPTELHLLIASHLPYPDALSLKHTSRHFFGLVDTGVRLKVAWLVSRYELHLDCPNDSRCDLRSDSNFCKGTVSRLMRRRRLHIECESRPGLGCLVYNTPQCTHRAALAGRAWLSLFRSIIPRGVAIALSRMLMSFIVLFLALFMARLGLQSWGYWESRLWGCERSSDVNEYESLEAAVSQRL